MTTHGATAALVDAKGDLVLPVLDYEFAGPDGLREAYEQIRPPFSETGTPKLPGGLNLGAQLFWQQKTFPDAFGQGQRDPHLPAILGAASSPASPQARSLRSAAIRTSGTRTGAISRRWSIRWAGATCSRRCAAAADMLGPLLPDVASRIGLDPGTPVACGIHDSNASLLPHLMTRKPPFAVVSTGTWVVSMAVGGRQVALDPARDTLVNVNAFGDPVPSARFMGGREFETIVGDTDARAGDEDWRAVLSEPVMLLPSVQQGSGPYPGRTAGWAGPEPAGGRRFLAASFYLALMTATCLDLIGADGDIVVEGPFAGNEAFLAMLSTATGRPVSAHAQRSTGTSFGAALLAGTLSESTPVAPIRTAGNADAMRSYAQQWFTLAAGRVD